MDARLNEPPKSVFIKSKIPPVLPERSDGSMPGNTIYEPKRKIIKNPMVLIILMRRSSMLNMFFMVVKNRFIILL